jgi:EAL domain-containing protein (putative c-di-GMP-specific phosphodiesterase class I)
MNVVAEGVESAAQLDYLAAHGCDQIQGYWLCRPVPATEAGQFILRHARDRLGLTMAA